ncbi:uncharacterized protein LOC121972391 [Zingiber officinale]|uniref:uncharacterized protein LOC121972391 n=1 Tax=Zingiber officinale TaxID=94328 RepID=UPI001C4CA4A5|nr:uncharacterized protein LOC121972391 [Zingiber officinale]
MPLRLLTRARADRLFYLLIVGHHHSTAIIHRRRCFLCLWSLWSQDSTEPLPHRLIVDAGPWFFSPLPASSSISHRQRGNEGHWLGEADLTVTSSSGHYITKARVSDSDSTVGHTQLGEFWIKELDARRVSQLLDLDHFIGG